MLTDVPYPPVQALIEGDEISESEAMRLVNEARAGKLCSARGCLSAVHYPQRRVSRWMPAKEIRQRLSLHAMRARAKRKTLRR